MTNDSMIDDLMPVHDDNKAGGGSSADNTSDQTNCFWKTFRAAIRSTRYETNPFSTAGWLVV